jgi:hypothetical protein
MRQYSRANLNWSAFRRAVWASVALHIVAACAILLLLHSTEERKPQPGIDTHAANEPQVQMHLVEDAVINIEPPQPQSTPQFTPQPAPQPKNTKPAEPSPSLPDKPFAPATPRPLPPEMLAIIRKPALQPVSEIVAETPVPPSTTANSGTVTDTNVKPAAGVNSSANAGPNAHSAGPSAPAIHGALKPEQTVVYILDCSGSMGAAGKLDAARAALIATLKQQPATVRFQVIVYAGSASPLLASNNKGLPANDANIRAATEKLATLEARGKSNHLEAVCAALAFRPDVILILTDADDLSAPVLKRVLANAPKPVPVCVGQVTAEGVQRPRELR